MEKFLLNVTDGDVRDPMTRDGNPRVLVQQLLLADQLCLKTLKLVEQSRKQQVDHVVDKAELLLEIIRQQKSMLGNKQVASRVK